ncbi:unnamed protein product [Penicillium nalgiovense]|nr:unnamed protein product [Penicillium nalgiovense]
MRQIVPGLILGNVQSSWNIEMLAENCFKAVVSLSDGLWGRWRSHTIRTVPEHHHKWVQGCRLVNARPPCLYERHLRLYRATGIPGSFLIDLLPIDDDHTKDSKLEAIMVHCDLGISRSPTIIIAYLTRKLHIPLMEVLEFVQSEQTFPRVRPSKNFTRQLQVWEKVGYQVWENKDQTVPKPAYKAFLDDRAALLMSFYFP